MNKTLKSYHIFTFPFQWEIKGTSNLTFSEKIDLKKINLSTGSSWLHIPIPKEERHLRELYNEKNFFYEFIHDVLYDNGNKDDIVRHYERKECIDGEGVEYLIGHKKSRTVYRLKIKSISLNLFSTGVGTLSFYLENHNYQNFDDLLKINQFGRRIYPPFLELKNGIEGTKDSELADFLAIEGLNDLPENYREDFNAYSSIISWKWKPAKFISNLLNDFIIDFSPVIDDRMFVTCWIGDNELETKIKNDSSFWKTNNDWYKLIFVDGENITCQNDEMQADLLNKHTLSRWQKYGTLYGFSRYSLVAIMGNNDFTIDVLLTYLRTMYFRIAELCFVQRASVLKFSDEVTRISTLSTKDPTIIAEQIRDLYKEYIRYVNKIYYREITAQEQGIEIYDKYQELMRVNEQVKGLDEEIEELHSYATLLDEKKQSKQLKNLTILGLLFIIPTFIISYYSLNKFSDVRSYKGIEQMNIALIVILLAITGIFYLKKKWIKIMLSILIIIIILEALFYGPFIKN